MEIVLTGAWVLGVLMLVTMAGLPVLQALAETARRGEPAAAEEGNPALDDTGVLWAPVSLPAQRAASPESQTVAVRGAAAERVSC